MKDEVPPAIVDAHSKAVSQATKDGKTVEPTFGLDKTGIAGTGQFLESCAMVLFSCIVM